MEGGFNNVRHSQDKAMEGIKEQSERDTKLELKVCRQNELTRRPQAFDLHRLVSPQGPAGKKDAERVTVASELLNKVSTSSRVEKTR